MRIDYKTMRYLMDNAYPIPECEDEQMFGVMVEYGSDLYKKFVEMVESMLDSDRWNDFKFDLGPMKGVFIREIEASTIRNGIHFDDVGIMFSFDCITDEQVFQRAFRKLDLFVKRRHPEFAYETRCVQLLYRKDVTIDDSPYARYTNY